MGFSVFLVLITIVCFLLILVIMVQNPKGGGLSSTLGGSQIGGVQKTTDFLDKSTWTLGITLIVLILLSSMSEFNTSDSITIDKGTAAPMKTTEIQNPVATPAQTPSATETPAETTTPAEATPEKQ